MTNSRTDRVELGIWILDLTWEPQIDAPNRSDNVVERRESCHHDMVDPHAKRSAKPVDYSLRTVFKGEREALFGVRPRGDEEISRDCDRLWSLGPEGDKDHDIGMLAKDLLRCPDDACQAWTHVGATIRSDDQVDVTTSGARKSNAHVLDSLIEHNQPSHDGDEADTEYNDSAHTHLGSGCHTCLIREWELRDRCWLCLDA